MAFLTASSSVITIRTRIAIPHLQEGWMGRLEPWNRRPLLNGTLSTAESHHLVRMRLQQRRPVRPNVLLVVGVLRPRG